MTMRSNEAIATPKIIESLEAVQQRFAHWRTTRSRLGLIPEPLWQQAVEQAQVHGVCRTAKALRLHAGTLSKKIQARTPVAESATVPLFVELAPLPMGGGCTVEFFHAERARMRVELPASARDELRMLTETFLGYAR
jgi:hypothetical protein